MMFRLLYKTGCAICIMLIPLGSLCNDIKALYDPIRHDVVYFENSYVMNSYRSELCPQFFKHTLYPEILKINEKLKVLFNFYVTHSFQRMLVQHYLTLLNTRQQILGIPVPRPNNISSCMISESSLVFGSLNNGVVSLMIRYRYFGNFEKHLWEEVLMVDLKSGAIQRNPVLFRTGGAEPMLGKVRTLLKHQCKQAAKGPYGFDRLAPVADTLIDQLELDDFTISWVNLSVMFRLKDNSRLSVLSREIAREFTIPLDEAGPFLDTAQPFSVTIPQSGPLPANFSFEQHLPLVLPVPYIDVGAFPMHGISWLECARHKRNGLSLLPTLKESGEYSIFELGTYKPLRFIHFKTRAKGKGPDSLLYEWTDAEGRHHHRGNSWDTGSQHTLEFPYALYLGMQQQHHLVQAGDKLYHLYIFAKRFYFQQVEPLDYGIHRSGPVPSFHVYGFENNLCNWVFSSSFYGELEVRIIGENTLNNDDSSAFSPAAISNEKGTISVKPVFALITYDSLGRMVAWGDHMIAYDEEGRVIRHTYSKGITQYAYDRLGRLSVIETGKPGVSSRIRLVYGRRNYIPTRMVKD